MMPAEVANPQTDPAESSIPVTAATPMAARPGILHRPLLYEDALKWFILLSSLDLLLTCVVLYMGGIEVNWIARQFLEYGDLYGLMAFKLVMVVLIILLCDYVGRRDDRRGRFISKVAVGMTSIPIVLALAQLVAFVHL